MRNKCIYFVGTIGVGGARLNRIKKAVTFRLVFVINVARASLGGLQEHNPSRSWSTFTDLQKPIPAYSWGGREEERKHDL